MVAEQGARALCPLRALGGSSGVRSRWPSRRRLPGSATAAGSVPTQVAFLDDALVRLAHALDAVLRLAAVVRKRADDLELAIGRSAQRTAEEAHVLAGTKLMTHVYLTFGTGIVEDLLHNAVGTGGARSSQAEMAARLAARRVAG